MKKMCNWFTCLHSDSEEPKPQSEMTLADLTGQESFQRHLSGLIHDDIHSSITKIVNSSRASIINKFEDNLNNIELLIINNVISNITSKIENRFETHLNDLDKHIQTLFHKMNNVKDIDGLSSMFSSKIDSMLASKLNVIDAHFNTLSQKMKELTPEELDAFRMTTSPKSVNSALLQDAAEAAEIFFETVPGIATEEPVVSVEEQVVAVEEPVVATEEPVLAEEPSEKVVAEVSVELASLKAEEIIKTPTFSPKSSLKMLVAQYHKQITVGCGKSNCTSDCCASNPDITLPSSPTSMVRMAINLTKSKAPLCSSAIETIEQLRSKESSN